MVPISIGVSLALIAIGVLVVLAFGIKSIINGKVELQRVIYISVPFVIFFISLAIVDDSVRAGIITMIAMIILMAIVMLISGFRNIFNY